LRLKQQGWYQRSIAAALGLAEDSVGRWIARARAGSPEALRARPAPGHPPKLSLAQKRLIPDCLWHGPDICICRVWFVRRQPTLSAQQRPPRGATLNAKTRAHVARGRERRSKVENSIPHRHPRSNDPVATQLRRIWEWLIK
jgi:hypothetical protein